MDEFLAMDEALEVLEPADAKLIVEEQEHVVDRSATWEIFNADFKHIAKKVQDDVKLWDLANLWSPIPLSVEPLSCIASPRHHLVASREHRHNIGVYVLRSLQQQDSSAREAIQCVWKNGYAHCYVPFDA